MSLVLRVLILGKNYSMVSNHELEPVWSFSNTYVYEDSVQNDYTGSDKNPKGHDFVGVTAGVKVFCQCPRSGIGIVRLDVSSAPSAVAVVVGQEVAVVLDDGLHDGIVDEPAKDSAVDLGSEHGSGCNFHWSRSQRVSWYVVGGRLQAVDLQYSPILRSLQRLMQFAMTLCDQAAKYMFPTGRPGRSRPAIILDKLLVAIPLPKRAYKSELCASWSVGNTVHPSCCTLTKGAMTIPRISEVMYAHTGKVRSSLSTTTSPKTNATTRILMYHSQGTSL